MNTQTYISTLVIEYCYSCGMAFGITTDFYRQRRDDHANFYCPAGHPQHYIGKSEAEKLREQLTAEKQEREWADSRAQAARDQADAAERRRRAAKGALTKLKNRVAAGVCPSCDQQFPDVGAHMEEAHPEFVSEAEEKR